MTGRIASKLTMNSQCTHWVSDPSPPVFGSRFMGGRIDSSKWSLGRIFISNENLAPEIYKRDCELVTTMKVLGRRTSAAVIPGCLLSLRIYQLTSSPSTACSGIGMDHTYLLWRMYWSNCLSNDWRGWDINWGYPG